MQILHTLLRVLARLARRSPVPSRDVVLYTRDGCHLCDEAHELLRRHGLQPTLVDIDGDAELKLKYDLLVPVVVIDGKERFRGRVNELLLKRLL